MQFDSNATISERKKDIGIEGDPQPAQRQPLMQRSETFAIDAGTSEIPACHALLSASPALT
ncbi:hypothetical protein N7451_007311 [Penicillium sp. IBT 35674x]|nr:hypothetical protein N7451_007311 [Penicillium sp. IBT 35674x]